MTTKLSSSCKTPGSCFIGKNSHVVMKHTHMNRPQWMTVSSNSVWQSIYYHKYSKICYFHWCSIRRWAAKYSTKSTCHVSTNSSCLRHQYKHLTLTVHVSAVSRRGHLLFSVRPLGVVTYTGDTVGRVLLLSPSVQITSNGPSLTRKFQTADFLSLPYGFRCRGETAHRKTR